MVLGQCDRQRGPRVDGAAKTVDQHDGGSYPANAYMNLRAACIDGLRLEV